MKVLQLGKFYPPDKGGIETTMFLLSEGLNSLGIHCDVLCSARRPLDEYENNFSYAVKRCKAFFHISSVAISPKMIYELSRVIDEYDIVHVHHPDPMAALALFLADNRKVKVILHWHSDIVRQRLLLRFYNPLLYWLLKRSDVIVATTHNYVFASNTLRKFINKVKVVPLGVKDLSAMLSIAFRTSNGEYVVFSLGRLVYYKGFEYLIEAIKYMSIKVRVLIGGEGPLKDYLEKVALRCGVQDKVIFLGKVSDEDLPRLYSECDIFCLPSIERSEAFGLVMAEAMSFGKPVIATFIPGSGVSWVNLHGVTGANVEPKNPLQLSNIISLLLVNKRLLKKFGVNGLRRFKETLNSNTMVKNFIKLYNSFQNRVGKQGGP